MLPADVGFPEDVLHVVFVEIMPLNGDGAVCLWVVIDVVVSTVTFQFITGSTELFNRLLSWVHYVPPIIILYTKLHNSQQKIHKNTQSTKQKEDVTFDRNRREKRIS